VSLGIRKIQHVKVPVTDVKRSAQWYARLLDLQLAREFVEDGVLRGVALVDRHAGFDVSLRDRSVCVGKPDLAGFDVVAFDVGSREGLSRLIARCQELNVDHGDVQERGPDGAAIDIPDPDGVLLRFTWLGEGAAPGFMGLHFSGGSVSFYDTPRVRLSGDPASS
jgi:catechol 2,3-dioxygenase-like lactoylglutathione lyase family enzyme